MGRHVRSFFDTEAGRYALELADGSCIRVKPECMAPVGGAIADGRQRPATLAPSADRQRQRGQGHKSIYKELAIEEAEAAIERFSVGYCAMHKIDRLHDRAAEICDAATDSEHQCAASKEKCAQKIKMLVCALKVLPLCTQAWEMLGASTVGRYRTTCKIC